MQNNLEIAHDLLLLLYILSDFSTLIVISCDLNIV